MTNNHNPVGFTEFARENMPSVIGFIAALGVGAAIGAGVSVYAQWAAQSELPAWFSVTMFAAILLAPTLGLTVWRNRDGDKKYTTALACTLTAFRLVVALGVGAFAIAVSAGDLPLGELLGTTVIRPWFQVAVVFVASLSATAFALFNVGYAFKHAVNKRPAAG